MLPCQGKHPAEGVVICKIASARIGVKIGCSAEQCEKCQGVDEEIIAQEERAGLLIALATPEDLLPPEGFNKMEAARKLMEPRYFRKGKHEEDAKESLRKVLLRGVELGADGDVLVDIVDQLKL